MQFIALFLNIFLLILYMHIHMYKERIQRVFILFRLDLWNSLKYQYEICYAVC